MKHTQTFLSRWMMVCVALWAMMLSAVRAEDKPTVVEGYTPWEKETLLLADDLPVQDGGRVKPFSSYAAFTMLRLHGDRSMKIEVDKKEVKIKPTAWMLDAFFRPQLAVKLPTFRVDNSAVIELIGATAKGKRDRYSYEEIQGSRERLFELESQYSKIKKEDRQPIESQLIEFADNVRSYEQLVSYFAFARGGVKMQGFPGKGGEPETKIMSVSGWMQSAPTIRAVLAESKQKNQQIPANLVGVLQQILDYSNYGLNGLLVVPPVAGEVEAWRPAGVLIMGVMNGESKNPEADIAEIQRMENVVIASEDQAAFRTAFGVWKKNITDTASKDELRSVTTEAKYNRSNFFMYSMSWFLMGVVLMFVMVIVMMVTKNKWARRITAGSVWACSLAGLAYCVTAISMRVWIMQRPPVGNLYDTIIFIAGGSVLVMLLAELATRRYFALAIAPVLGSFFVTLSILFEMGDAKDHMDPLVAVLRSNYWLTVHVITITMGYCGGLVSAVVSLVYVLGRMFGLFARNERRLLTRLAYGCVCLTLIFSLIGTVLGGVWANDSWGRFWGWDPKENGALMIVLWSLAILHARLGGYIKEWGLHLASLFGACIVTFSWWHVNFLGVGLHNYGFTEGRGAINAAYIFIGTMVLIGSVCALVERFGKQEKQPEGLKEEH